MGELAGAIRMFSSGKNLGLHVIQWPSGRWGFVGHVPSVLAYVHADGSCPTDSECKEIRESSNPAMMCESLGIKTRSFDSKEQAQFAAARAGLEVQS